MSGGGGFRGRGFVSRGHFRQGSDAPGGPNLPHNRNDSRPGNANPRSRGPAGPRMGFRGNGPRPNLRPNNNWPGSNWSDNNGCNNWPDNNGCNNWANSNWSDNNGINIWADNNGGNNWSDNGGGNNWSPQGMPPPQGMGPSRGGGPPRGFPPWHGGCPSRFNAPPPFFHPRGQNTFAPYRFLPPMGARFPRPNIPEYSSTEGSPNAQNQPAIQNSTNLKQPSIDQKIQNPPKPEKPQKQTPHPGSEEERAQKITEAADKLKRTLSTIKKKIPDGWYENEDDSVELSPRDSDCEPRIAHRGIPELKHDPPELNLTLNDLRDIGRVDHDYTTRGTNASNETPVDDPEVVILEHNPVELPKTTIDLSQEDYENDDDDNTTQSGNDGDYDTSKNIAHADENSLSNVAKIDYSCTDDIEHDRSGKTIMDKPDERLNEEENFAEEQNANDSAQRDRREEINEDNTQNMLLEHSGIPVAENSRCKEMFMDDDREEMKKNSDDAFIIETERTEEEETATDDIDKTHDEEWTIDRSAVLCQDANTDSAIGVNAEMEKGPVDPESYSVENVKTCGRQNAFEESHEEHEVGEKMDDAEEATVNFGETSEKEEQRNDETTKGTKSKVVIPGEKNIVTEVRTGSETAMAEEKTKENREENDNDVWSEKVDPTDGTSTGKEINVDSMKNLADANVKSREESCDGTESDFHDNTLINEMRENATRVENNKIIATTDNVVTSLQVRDEIIDGDETNDENKEKSRLIEKEGSTEKETGTKGTVNEALFLEETKTQERSNLILDNRQETEIISSKSPTSQLSLPPSVENSKDSESQQKLEEKSSTGLSHSNQKRGDNRRDSEMVVSTDGKLSDSKYSKGLQRDDSLETDAKIREQKKLEKKLSQENEASKNRKSASKDSKSETGQSPKEDFHPSDSQSSLESTSSNSCNRREQVNSSQSKKHHFSSTTKRQTDEILPSSVKYDPKQPPPNIIGIQDNTQPNLPPAFDPRLSSHERSVILSSAIPMKQDFIMTQGYPPCTMTNVRPINYVVPNSIKPTSGIPPICMPDPYVTLMPLPNVPSLVPSMVLPTDILLQPPLPAELPPPPPPPVKSTINMEAELEDMQEAMEFAKQFMNMTEPCKTIENPDINDADLSDESDIFHMPTFPDLPPIETPLLLPSVETEETKNADDADCSRTTSEESAKDPFDKNGKHESTVYGPAPRPEEYSDSLDQVETVEECTSINDEHLRPKVVFNLNSKLKKISKQDEWHLQGQRDDQHENSSPTVSTTMMISSMEMRRSRKNKITASQSSTPPLLSAMREKSRVGGANEEAKQNDDKTSWKYNGNVDSSRPNFSQSVKTTGESKSRSLTPPRHGKDQKSVKHSEENSRKSESSKSGVSAKRLGKESSSKKSRESQTPESAWKNRVIGRFLKMSKNDICNMLNNASLRKFDIAMKHLVKERRPSLSLEMRNNEEERMRDAETTYNRDEFMDQLSAMLDPSATVDIGNLPTQFIHHLSEVLQLDVTPEFGSQQNKAETIAKVSSPSIQPPSGTACRQTSADVRETGGARKIDEQRGRKKEKDKQSSNTMEEIVSAKTCLAKSTTGSLEKPKVSCASERPTSQWLNCEKVNAGNPSNRGATVPRLRRRRLRAAVPEEKTKPPNHENVVSDQGTLNMADLDDIFSAGIARVKKKFADDSKAKTPRNNDQHCDDDAKVVDKNVAHVIKDPSVDRVERAVDELDEIFSAGIARAKLASKKAAEATKVAEADDADADASELSWNQSDSRYMNSDGHRLKQKTSTSVRNSPKIDEWNRRKNCEEPATFRNLTKEEWEARYGESSYSSYQREYRAMEALRAQKLQCGSTGERQNFDPECGEISSARSRLLELNTAIPDFHEAWSFSDETHRRFRSSNEASNHEINYNRNNDDSSSTTSTSSDSSEKSNDEAAPSVTKLLKVIKEREKIAKKKSLNEEIRDEVTAEIERKKRERSKVHKRHKLRTKKSGHHRRKRDRKDYSRDKKKRDRKRKKHKSRRSNENSRDNSDYGDADEEYTSSPARGRSSRRLLAEDEIKKEIIVKEEPAIEVGLTSENVHSKNCSLPTTVVTTSIVNQTTIVAQQPKTKAQLKQMPNDLAKKVTTVARVNKEPAKSQISEVSDNAKDSAAKNVAPATLENTSVTNVLEDSVDSKDTNVTAPVISVEKSVAPSDDTTSKNNSKKLDIKTYKERARQRQQKEIEKIRLLTENPSSLTQNLLNIPLTRKNENEPPAKSIHEPLTDPRLKKTDGMLSVSTITDTTAIDPASSCENSASMLSAKTSTSRSIVERKKIVRRPIAAIVSTSVQTTVENLPVDVGKFAHIKSEGRKELKLRERLKRERLRTVVDGKTLLNNVSSPQPTKLKRRKNVAVATANETVPGNVASASEIIPRNIAAANETIPGNVASRNETIPGNAASTNETIPGNAAGTNETIPGNAASTNETIPGNAASTNETIPGNADSTNETIPGNAASTNETIPRNAASTNETMPRNLASTKETISRNVASTIEPIPVAEEAKPNKVPLSDNLDDTKTHDDSNTLMQSTTETVITAKDTDRAKLLLTTIVNLDVVDETSAKTTAVDDPKPLDSTKIIPETLDTAESGNETNESNVTVSLDNYKTPDIAATLEESKNVHNTEDSEPPETPNMSNQSPTRLPSDGLPEIQSEDPPSAINDIEKETIPETESELIPMELPVEDLTVWSLDAPLIAGNISDTMEYSSDGGGPFKGFSEETILRRDRVLTEAEITEDSELTTFESVPLKFVSDGAASTTENIDLNVLTGTGVVDNLDVPLTYPDDEFSNGRDEIESSLLPDSLGHQIFSSVASEITDVPSTIDLMSLQNSSIDEKHDKNVEAENLRESSVISNLENSSNIDDFIIENVRTRETVPSPILDTEAAANEPDDLETVALPSKIENGERTEIKTIDGLENDAREVENSSIKLLTNTANTSAGEEVSSIVEPSAVETETLEHRKSIVTPENDVGHVMTSLLMTVDENNALVGNSEVSQTRCNAITSLLSSEVKQNQDVSRINDGTCEASESEDIPKNSSYEAGEVMTSSKETEKSSTACQEKPEVDERSKSVHHSRIRDHSYDRIKKKSSRHHNHGSRAAKKSAITGKMVEDAITANVVKLVAKPNSRDTVMARMIEIDVEIHKLMNEKMTLYKMLQSGDFASQESPDSSNKTYDETKKDAEKDETTEVVSTNVLASCLAQNLTSTPSPVIPTTRAATSTENDAEEPASKADARRSNPETEDKRKKGKKSPHCETKNRSTERDVVIESRGEKKSSDAKCNTTRITRASEESSRHETASRHSREKSTSSTDLEDAEEKLRGGSMKSPTRRHSKCRSVHSSKEDLVQARTRDDADRVEKLKKNDESKRDRAKKKPKSSTESRNMEETVKKSKIHDEKSAGISDAGKKIIRTDDIYSDESTLESQVLADETKSNEARDKKDKPDNYTGLTLLEKSFQRDAARHRKIKNSERRRSKKRDLRRAMRDPTILTPNEAQTGLINLLNRKILQKRNSVSSLNRDKSKHFVSTNGDAVKVWKHVSNVIDAVAKNRIDELYTEESSKPPRNGEPSSEQTRDKVTNLHVQRDKNEKTDMEEKVVAKTPEETTAKPEGSGLRDKPETAITADCKGFSVSEASGCPEAMLAEKQQSKSSNLEITNPETPSKPSEASSCNIPKTPEMHREKSIEKSGASTNRDEVTSSKRTTSYEESFDDSTVDHSDAERENDQTGRQKVRSITAANPKPWRMDLFEKTVETPKERSAERSEGFTTWKEGAHKDGKQEEKVMEEHPEADKTCLNENNDDIPRSRSRNSRRTKQRGKSQSGKGSNAITQKRDNQNSSHEHVNEDHHHHDGKSSRRPRSATKPNLKQHEKSDRSRRRTSRPSEDRSSKSSRYRKREHDRSISRGPSPSEDERPKKRSLHHHRSSSPAAPAFDDRSKKAKGGKRKRRAEMSLEEMTRCKVELIDCKYTYLSPTMHPKILKKLGISRINRYVAPRTIAETPPPPLPARNETRSSPTLNNVMNIARRPKVEDNEYFEKIEIPTGISATKIVGDIVEAEEEAKKEKVELIPSSMECLIVKENVDDDDEDDEDDDNIQIVKAVDESLPSIEHGEHEDDDNESNKEIIRDSLDQADNTETGTEMITVEEDDDTMEEYEVIDEVTDENEDTDENEQINNEAKDTEHEEAAPASTVESGEAEKSLASEENDIETEPRRTRYTVHKGPILDIKVLDDSFLAASEDGAIYRYSQTSNGILNIYKGHDAAVTCIYVLEMPGKRWNLYSGSLDGTFRSYDITTGAQDRPANVGSPVQCMDQGWGIIYIGTKSGHISRYNIKSGSLKGDRLEFSDKSVLALKASIEGPRRVLIVASRNQPITIRDANTGLFLRTICGYKNHTVYSLMRDRNLVYCGTSSTSIPVYDFTNGEQITQYNAGVGIVCMRLYRQILFAGCYDGNIYVFDTKESKLLCSIPGPGNMLLSMEVVNDEIIAGSKNRQLHLWRMPKRVQALLAERT